MANRNNKLTKAPEKTEEPSITKKQKRSPFRRITKTILLIIGIVIFGTIALFTTLSVMVNQSNLRAARAEYDTLRDMAYEIGAAPHDFGDIHQSVLDEEMRRINPEYVCWIRVDGTNIDYPVVRGDDNEKYLKTSFYGEQSVTGSVFLDYRIVGDFLSYTGETLPHIIIYGHNLVQGGIFSDLRRLLNPQFLEENNIVTLIANDEAIEFEIFSVRLSDINDPAYFLNFSETRDFSRFANRINAPLAATQILTLSTCVRSRGEDARLIVQAYRLFN